MNHLYKLILASSLLIISLSATAQEDLVTPQTEIIHELCSLMDQAAQAEQYWQEVNHSKLKKYISSPPTVWFDEKWHHQTPLKADIAKALFDKLAFFLGSLELHHPASCTLSPETDKAWHALKAESYSLLNTCAIPSVWHRHWIKYTAASSIIIAGYLLTKHKLSGKTLFQIEGDSLKDVISHIPDGPNNYLCNYRYAQKDGINYIEVVNHDAPAIRNFLGGRLYQERTTQLTDLTTRLYNEDGRTHFAHWINEHCVKPCQNMYEILFKDKQHEPDQAVLGSNTKKAVEDVNNDYTLWISDAQKSSCPKIKECIEKSLNGRIITSLSVEEKESIITDFYFYLVNNSNKVLNEIIAYIGQQQSSTFTRTALLSTPPPAAQSSESSDLIARIFGLSIIKTFIQKNALANLIRELVAKQQLTFGMMATIPATVAGYAFYKSTIALTNRITKRTFIEPLKHDLLSLQITLNGHRYQDTLDTHTIGICRYLTARLQGYIKKLSAKERPRYIMYNEQLANDMLTPEQRIQIIECMFKEFNFLH